MRIARNKNVDKEWQEAAFRRRVSSRPFLAQAANNSLSLGSFLALLLKRSGGADGTQTRFYGF